MAAPELRLEIEIDIEDPKERGGPPLGEPGASVGRYRLLHEIATGGMATVYLAMPEGGTEPVALKRVHPHLASQREFIEMFLDEARLTSRVDHPNVCPVLDYGRADGSYFLVMEYLSGCSLARVSRALRRLSAAEQQVAVPVVAARVVADAAAGLHAAHELRDGGGKPLEVVHRDVSPHNLFVAWSGATFVLDFGIASARDRLHHTETGTVKGKFAYMAPEQMVGARVDRRADVWSLGVVLWELLAGQPLFKRRTETETVMAVTRLERPPLAELRPGLCPKLEAIVDRALAREPEDRFPNAGAMADELRAWLDEQPGPGDPAEVAAWMDRLFPGEAAEEAALVRKALAKDLAPFDATTGHEQSGVVRRDRKRRGLAVAYLIALALAIAVGALAALASRPGAPDPIEGAGPVVTTPPE